MIALFGPLIAGSVVDTNITTSKIGYGFKMTAPKSEESEEYWMGLYNFFFTSTDEQSDKLG